jgi:hypothetical protein
VLVDLWLLQIRYRTIAFVGLGALLLICSLAFSRVKEFLETDPPADRAHHGPRLDTKASTEPPARRASLPIALCGSDEARRWAMGFD